MSTNNKRLLLALSVLLLAASVLTACTYSIPGGLAGVIGALALAGALLGLGATTSGCDSTSACLSIVPDVGACLTPALDAGPDGSLDVGPCLQPSLDAGPDKGVDVGPCLQPSDMYIDSVGPCLTPRLPDQGLGALDPAPSNELPHQDGRELQRERAIARLGERLPADVARRLGGGSDDGDAGSA